MSLFCRAVSAVLLSGVICFAVELQAAPPIRPEQAKSEGKKADEAKFEKSADEFDQAALEKKFTEDMSGVVFAGSYSVTRDNTEAPAEMEKYTITRVSKGENGLWTFQARIQYGKHDLALPIALKVKWAGDTPVITLTDLTIPGLGTFTSRVLIYGDRYAGTWQHGKVGGHLWGRIEKIDKTEKTEKPAAGDAGKEGDAAAKKPSGS
ncbi:MAG: hypothetical protein JSS02_10555 [Planctomycetes bacterium]|nr:hypothetical protein [Planctomycetota bacterium]